jgi:molybdenum cofactor cytidylyltransferase
VILAAGEATRMGVAKPALPFGESTMVGAVVDIARSAGLDPVVVVTGFHRDEVASAIGDAAVVAHNDDAASGNMSSLLVGIGAAGDVDAVVVLLSDMPLVEVATVEALCRGLLASGAACAWTRYRTGRGHPIAFTRTGMRAIGGLRGEKALWPYFDALRADQLYELIVDSPRPVDINTTDDYRALLDTVGGGEAP